MYLTQLAVYPVKSLCGQSLSSGIVQPQGLLGDRMWLIGTADGNMITARKNPSLLLWQSEFATDSGSLNIILPSGECVATQADLYTQAAPVKVWKDEFTAYHGDEAADEQLSQALGLAVRLYYLGQHSTRQLNNHATPLTFADGAPFLLTNTASLNELNRQLNQPIEMARFRANLVISGCLPYEEEQWQQIQIGGVVFEMLHPCTRCVMPTIDLNTGEKHPQQQPLSYLAQHRQAIFGMNVRALNAGQISVGDVVQVLA